MLVYIERDFNAEVHLWQDIRDHAVQRDDGLLEFLAKTHERRVLYELKEIGASSNDFDQILESLDPDEVEQMSEEEREAHIEELRESYEAGLQLTRYPLVEAGEVESIANVSVDDEPPPGSRLYLRHHPTTESDRPDDALEVSGREVLMAADGVPLVTRLTIDGDADPRTEASAVILVHNASFLLNYSLIDPARRELAVKVADALGEQRKVVIFEPPVMEGKGGGSWFWGDGDKPSIPSPVQQMLRPPLSWILLHWLVMGLVFLAARSLIFGRPHDPASEEVVAFDEHVRAYGALLARSRDRTYAKDTDRRLQRSPQRPRPV